MSPGGSTVRPIRHSNRVSLLPVIYLLEMEHAHPLVKIAFEFISLNINIFIRHVDTKSAKINQQK